MGMYDSINGEQVKCFPWAHFYNDDIVTKMNFIITEKIL